MSKLKNMRAIEIPKFRAVSSGLRTFDELFGDNSFSKWIDVDNAYMVMKQITDEIKTYLSDQLKMMLLKRTLLHMKSLNFQAGCFWLLQGTKTTMMI